MSQNQLIPRGLRNNNPLNIRHSRDKWQGSSLVQNDTSFVTFDTIEYGYRAAFRILYTYHSSGLKTLREWITRWAPPEDNNNTTAYIQTVSKIAGIASDVPIDIKDKMLMCKIVAGMHQVENGAAYPAITAAILKGYELAKI